MRQRCGALGRTLSGDDVAVDVVDAPLPDTGLQQVQASGHARQQVVEVVR